ncbi:MAG: type IIL restriction-modification enzyme MmeI, partial [Mariprofundales bacterium]
KEFGKTNPTLPLKEAGKIVQGNATRLDWEQVCPKNEGDEIYILGNPPYLGARYQEDKHRQDIHYVLNKIKGYKRLDYISLWFFKGAIYINNVNSKLAFVTTNSMSQGEQAIIFWPNVLINNIEISFAHQSFKWTNNAKGNAGVTVAIIALQNKSNNKKYLFSNNSIITTKNINFYLTTASNIFVQKRSNPLSFEQKIERTNPALDNGYLLLNENEKNSILANYPQAMKIIKPVVGAAEFLRGINKYCIWINDEDLELANSIHPVAERIEKVRKYRLKRKNTASKNTADFPHQFLKMKLAIRLVLFLPTVSSEKREFIPIGFLNNNTVIIDPNFAIYDPEPYLLGILSSRMHMTWVRTVAGRLKMDYRYSSTLVYNTFPFPKISTQRKNEITQAVFRILEEREKHSEKTLAQLYDPDKMPAGLLEAHQQNDTIIERCYRSKPFKSDEERLEYLFKLYEKMINEEKEKNALLGK